MHSRLLSQYYLVTFTSFDRLDFCVWTIHKSPSLAHIIGHDINMGMISFGS